MRLDIIGDVHGQLGALMALLDQLGYREDPGQGLVHPEGRRLLFIGDLIDRGPDSFEVARRVARACEAGQAACLMGNHEFNLIRWRRGLAGPKPSNVATIRTIQEAWAAWEPLLDFFERLPLAIALPGAPGGELRATHAAWNPVCLEALEVLRQPGAGGRLGAGWDPYVRLYSPFEGGQLRAGLPTQPFQDPVAGLQEDPALDIWLKGYEIDGPPFLDNDGTPRSRVRAEWWREPRAQVPGRAVCGHYWNMPPLVDGDEAPRFSPPFPSGHPDQRAWLDARATRVPASGRLPVPAGVPVVCVDYNGVTRAEAGNPCVGAYRHPEAEVAWSSDAGA